MKIGVRAHDYGRRGVEECAILMHKEGYEAVQLAIPKTFTGIMKYEDITEGLLNNIREAFCTQQVEIAVLGCYMDLSHPDKETRQAAVSTFCRCLRYSKIIGAKMTGSETAYGHLSKMEKHRRFPYMLDSLKRLAEEAERLDVWMGIEPVAWHPLEDTETAAETLHILGSSHVKIILDPANILERPKEINQSAYWKRCLDLLGNSIEAVHLKDFKVDSAGNYIPTLLGEGVMEYDALEKWLADRPEMPVLREEMNPAAAGRELKYMREMKERKRRRYGNFP